MRWNRTSARPRTVFHFIRAKKKRRGVCVFSGPDSTVFASVRDIHVVLKDLEEGGRTSH